MDKLSMAIKNVKVVKKGFRIMASESSNKIIEKLVADSDDKTITALIEYGAEMYNSGVVDALTGAIIGSTAALIVGGSVLVYKHVKTKKLKKSQRS